MILLDTHVLIWAVTDDPRLGSVAQAAIEETGRSDRLAVSAITPWEIALLVQKGRLHLEQEVGTWIETALALPSVQFLPIEPAIAVSSVLLPGAFHADPADRFIVATARHFGISLLTADRAILAYAANGHVDVLDAGR